MKASDPLFPVQHNVPEPFRHGHVGDVIKVVIGGPEPFQTDPEQRAPATGPPSPKVPRTTAWRRRKAEEAAAAARAQGLTPKIRRTPEHLICQKCGQPKTKEFGHSQFRGVHFCAQASGKTVAQWLEEVKKGQT